MEILGTRSFIKGEVKHVKLTVSSIKRDEFTVDEATYSLIRQGQCTVEAAGDCTIEGHTIDALISPMKVGSYELVFTYIIADETLMGIVKVVVS